MKKPDVLVQLGNKKKKEQKQQWFALKLVYKEKYDKRRRLYLSQIKYICRY